MTEEEYKKDNPNNDHEKLHAQLMRCLAELHIAALKEVDSNFCSADAHRGRVFRELRDWVRQVEKERS